MFSKTFLFSESVILFCIVLCISGCSSEVGIRRATMEEKHNYTFTQISGGELSGDTVNLLGDYSFIELYKEAPDQLIVKLAHLFARERRGRYLIALSDVALAGGMRFDEEEPDLAARYFIDAALCSKTYLIYNGPERAYYDVSGIRMIVNYNTAVSKLFSYLHKRSLIERSGFELQGIIGGTIRFRETLYELPVKKEQIRHVKLCEDYQPVNLTHNSRRFGMGVPLIIEVDNSGDKRGSGFVRNMTIPSTFFIEFDSKNWCPDGKFSARGCFFDSSKTDCLKYNKRRIPLAQDLTTPLVYMVKEPPLFNFIDYTRLPEDSMEQQGLYRFSPVADNKIPVVFVHGLLSDTRTWLQMINTLQNDKDIRNNYQFFGFSYSSGNPVFHSAAMLRQALNEERMRMTAAGRSTEKFDRMVIIGHSMGGLLSRIVVSDSDCRDKNIDKKRYDEMVNKLSERDKNKIERITRFKPLPFVRRVVFIAVPHRGSSLAQTGIAKFGASLIKLPIDVVNINRFLFNALLSEKMQEKTNLYFTGVDNLDPDSKALKYIEKLPMSDKVAYHSVIGNKERSGTPGGSDGIVPYSSSHLDNVESEFIVKSGHSAHKEPLAIQEIRRILLLHLEKYSDSVISAPMQLKKSNDGVLCK